MVECVAIPDRSRAHHINGGAAVVVQGRAEVETSATMGAPGRAGERGVVGDHELARGMQGMGGEVERGAKQASIGREGGVEGPGAEVIDGQLRMRKEPIPKVKREVGVDSREDREEMVFERADVALGRVGPMVVGGHVLHSRRRRERAEEGGEGGGALVVCDKSEDRKTAAAKKIEHPGESGNIGGSSAARHRLDMDITMQRRDEHVLLP